MDTCLLRRSFAEFLGDEKFRKFLASSRPSGRSLFWHEQAWQRFVVAQPDYAVSFDELRAALRFCEQHGLDLLPGPIGTWYCPVCHEAEEAEQARQRDLPPLIREMGQPRRPPDEGIAISDLIDALRVIEVSEEIIDKRILNAILLPDGVLLIKTGERICGDVVCLRRTEGGWEITDFTRWCS